MHSDPEPNSLSPDDLAICQPRTLHRAQVAMMLGISVTTFSTRLPDLLKKGFPNRLPGLNVWPRMPVETWIDCGGLTDAGAPDTAPDTAPDADDDDLLRRYGDLHLAVNNG